MLNKSLLVILSTLIFTINACSSNDNMESALSEIEFSILHSEIYVDTGIFTSKNSKIFNSQNEYETELKKYSNKSGKVLDFSKGKVLLVDMGARNSGGYSINVSSISGYNGYAIAMVELSKPGANCFTSQSMTNPYQFIWIMTQHEILLNEKLLNVDCQ